MTDNPELTTAGAVLTPRSLNTDLRNWQRHRLITQTEIGRHFLRADGLANETGGPLCFVPFFDLWSAAVGIYIVVGNWLSVSVHIWIVVPDAWARTITKRPIR